VNGSVRVLLHGARGDYCRDSVFEDQLLLIAGFEHQRILIEALDTTGEFHATQQIDGHQTLIFARIIEKTVLYVLRWFIHLRSCLNYCPEKSLNSNRADCIVTQCSIVFLFTLRLL
jgi:hypothetical protein